MSFENEKDGTQPEERATERGSTINYSGEQESVDIVRQMTQREPVGRVAQTMLNGFSLFIDELNEPGDRSHGVFLRPGQTLPVQNDNSADTRDRVTTLAYPEGGNVPRPDEEATTLALGAESGSVQRPGDSDLPTTRAYPESGITQRPGDSDLPTTRAYPESGITPRPGDSDLPTTRAYPESGITPRPGALDGPTTLALGVESGTVPRPAGDWDLPTTRSESGISPRPGDSGATTLATWESGTLPRPVELDLPREGDSRVPWRMGEGRLSGGVEPEGGNPESRNLPAPANERPSVNEDHQPTEVNPPRDSEESPYVLTAAQDQGERIRRVVLDRGDVRSMNGVAAHGLGGSSVHFRNPTSREGITIHNAQIQYNSQSETYTVTGEQEGAGRVRYSIPRTPTRDGRYMILLGRN